MTDSKIIAKLDLALEMLAMLIKQLPQTQAPVPLYTVPLLDRLNEGNIQVRASLAGLIRRWDGGDLGWKKTPKTLLYCASGTGCTIDELHFAIRSDPFLHTGFSKYPQCGYAGGEDD